MALKKIQESLYKDPESYTSNTFAIPREDLHNLPNYRSVPFDSFFCVILARALIIEIVYKSQLYLHN